MAKSRTVEEGDHLADLAWRHGFKELKPLLDEPKNRALAKRKNPNILEPAEQVELPDPKPKTVKLAIDTKHVFVRPSMNARLRLKLAGILGAKLKVTSASASIDGDPSTPLTVGDDGKATLPIPPLTREVGLMLSLEGKDARDVEWTCRVGARRVEFEPGAFARLRNLGYYRPDVMYALQDRERISAIEEFQHDHKLTVNGKLDAATTKKLEEIHGS